jgi:Family of unknown function (DUF6504)
MRRYDDPVDVRRGRVAGVGGTGTVDGTGDLLVEGPEQFLWRGRLWKVSAVVAHWVETGAWWQSSGVHAVLGTDAGTDPGARSAPADLSAEREVWRVEADRGMSSAQPAGTGRGVFDLAFDWADGGWRLTRCLD